MDAGTQQDERDSPVGLDVSSNEFADEVNLPLLPNESDSKATGGLRRRRIPCPSLGSSRSEAATQTEGSSAPDTPRKRRKGLAGLSARARCSFKTVLASLFAIGVLFCVYFSFLSEDFITRDIRLTQQLYDDIDDQIRSNGRMVTLGSNILGKTFFRAQGRVPLTVVQASVMRYNSNQDQARLHIEIQGRVPNNVYRGQPSEMLIGLRIHYHCGEVKVTHLEGWSPEQIHFLSPGCDPWKPCESTLVRTLSKLVDWLRELEAPNLAQYFTYYQQPYVSEAEASSQRKRQHAESVLVQIGFIVFGLCVCLVLVCTCYIFVSEEAPQAREAE